MRRTDGRWPGSAIDTWGVDYGLLDANGALRGNPHAYRDPRSEATIEKVHQQIEPARLYAVNGLQVIRSTPSTSWRPSPTCSTRTASC